MSRVPHPFAARRRMAGLSLIEMMIALVMALIVAAGIITVFTSTSSSNKVQQQMAALQEEGRFAIQSLRSDLANANGGYCSNSGGNADVTGAGLYLDGLRSPVVYATDMPTINAAFGVNTTPLAWASTPQSFSLPSRMFMRGYECTTATCLPVNPDSAPADAPLAVGTPAKIPAMGTGVGARVPGTDVLTVRYLKPGSGWAIVPATGSYITTVGNTTTITLRPLSGEDPKADFTGNLAMVADCSSAKIVAVSGGGSGTLTVTGANSQGAQSINAFNYSKSAPRVFDFDNDFQTVTYFLQVVCTDGTNPCDHTTGELVRRVNANGTVTDQPLVRGVERLNFSYGIIDANGVTRFLTANEVATGVVGGTSIACYVPSGWTSDVDTPGGMDDSGCLWRAVQTIQVSILMDGQTPLYTLTPAEMSYVYTPDGNTLEAPALHPVNPNADQGFPIPLIRREFTTLVALRNFNP